MSTRDDMDDLVNSLQGASLHDSRPGIVADVTNSPLRRFFLQHPVGGYTYSGRSPTTEWQDYLDAKGWTSEQCHKKGSRQRKLYRKYLAAVEEEVDYLIQRNEQVRDGELKPWEYLCKLFEVGEAPLSKKKAKKLLRPIHINIYDFIDYQQAQQAGQHSVLTRFPKEGQLAEYSYDTGRVYPLSAAKKDGMLRLLLRKISRAASRVRTQK
ncbi:hypothetical protein BDZ91DRAFT_750601 [Kalaharituber pfeilii]|nr:hypothetical protein BDZ91DRAFT_750601 [Kalaharituber pfeilii]